ncbi:MAG: SIMPL domain-containing protein [Clostridia bacterium]|nr:SIMPL domain-containing protein [Clostridia bacterium]
MNKQILPIICAVCLTALLTGCKAEDEIVNVPTPKIEQQTVVLEREKSAPEHYFEVTGNGEIIAVPDFATVTLRVTGSGETAEEASAACQEEAQKLNSAAISLHILKHNLQQRGIEIVPVTDETGKNPTTYLASDVITLTITQVGRTEQIVAALVDAGNNELVGVTYSIAESSEAYRNALSAAIDDARSKAETMAESTGVRLGDVIGIVETAFDETKLIGVAFESSAIAVNAQVTVRYKIG